MIRRYVMTATILGIAACATSVPEVRETDAGADESVTKGTPTTTPGNVEVVEIPKVAQVTDIPVRDEVICSRERRTGTNRVKKVCRSRSSIERTSAEGKETFEVLRKSQVEYP